MSCYHIYLGSRQPYAMKATDADFNVGMAVGALHGLHMSMNAARGVYIIIDGTMRRVDCAHR